MLDTPVDDRDPAVWQCDDGTVCVSAAAVDCSRYQAPYDQWCGAYTVRSTDRGHKAAMRLEPIPNKSGLAKSNITVADALKAAGYVTGIFAFHGFNGTAVTTFPFTVPGTKEMLAIWPMAICGVR